MHLLIAAYHLWWLVVKHTYKKNEVPDETEYQ